MNKKSDNATSPLAARLNDFATDLYGAVGTPPGNLFFSPFSIWTLLSMASAGARGDTRRQMADALHVDLDGPDLHTNLGALANRWSGTHSSGYRLINANGLWTQPGLDIVASFVDLVRTAMVATSGRRTSPPTSKGVARRSTAGLPNAPRAGSRTCFPKARSPGWRGSCWRTPSTSRGCGRGRSIRARPAFGLSRFVTGVPTENLVLIMYRGVY